MQRRSRFDLSRRRLIQGLGLGAAAGPLLPLLNADAQTAPRPKRLLLIFTPDGAPALNFNTTIDWKPTGTEAAFMLQMIQAPLQPYAAKMVVPWGLNAHRRRGRRGARLRDGGAVDRDDAAGAEHRRQLRRRQRSPHRVGQRRRRSIRSSRRRTDRTCRTSGPRTTRTRRRGTDRSRSACSARARTR